MPQTPVVFFKDDDGCVPFLEWFDELPTKVQDKCRLRIERLSELGHELRRPETDYLRDGIYELRVRHQSVNYRIRYFFHRQAAAVLSHGLQKERAVPPREIDLAAKRKARFDANPKKHTARRNEHDEEKETCFRCSRNPSPALLPGEAKSPCGTGRGAS